jgi:SAM-dependent methyltransferase
MRRLPFRAGTFDIVVNLFTSFGYFADDGQHQRVLREVAGVLKHGGVLVLDYFNSPSLMAGLIEREERAVGSQRVIIQRRISDDQRFVLKEMHMMDDGRSFIERVRLFDPDELVALVSDAGMEVMRRFGDYDASPLTADSPRLIIMAELK